ncbi:MAG: NAD-dependent epimerase/dehydratase family protein [Alphaproteobacteria bacterium]|nr:NAD-dependent epimerase/dehydratase family protein [Alphaproteobacteria bacterium]
MPAAGSTRILITGAAGFIGRALAAELVDRGIDITAAVRVSPPAGLLPTGSRIVAVGDIERTGDWRPALVGVTHVVHLAGRAHVAGAEGADRSALFHRVNRDATASLAAAAREAGVRRFVFVSTIKVHGEAGHFSEADPPRPVDPYGRSKWQGEQALLAAAGGRMETVILRPPLVYGPHVKANFLALLRLAATGLPVPVAAADNRRSLIYVANLVSAIGRCLDHGDAAGGTFLVGDGEDLSPRDLVRRLAVALGRRPRILALPPAWLRAALALVGRRGAADRLCDTLTLDDSRIRLALAWQPPHTLDDGLRATAKWYRDRRL